MQTLHRICISITLGDLWIARKVHWETLKPKINQHFVMFQSKQNVNSGCYSFLWHVSPGIFLTHTLCGNEWGCVRPQGRQGFILSLLAYYTSSQDITHTHTLSPNSLEPKENSRKGKGTGTK